MYTVTLQKLEKRPMKHISCHCLVFDVKFGVAHFGVPCITHGWIILLIFSSFKACTIIHVFFKAYEGFVWGKDFFAENFFHPHFFNIICFCTIWHAKFDIEVNDMKYVGLFYHFVDLRCSVFFPIYRIVLLNKSEKVKQLLKNNFFVFCEGAA